MIHRAVAGALAVAAIAIPLAGCGGGKKSDTTTTVQTTHVQVTGHAANGLDAAALYKQLAPGVVTVISIFPGSPNPLSGGGGGEEGLGSGFVVDGDGYIATNAHVIATGDRVPLRKASSVYVEFADGNRVPAKIVGYDPNADVGLVKIDPSGLKLVPLQFGDSSKAVVGAPVAAIGSPFGEEQSLSVGVISAVDRSIQSLTQFQIGNALQTDAAINHGNSGGPLLDAEGKVLGINSQIKSSSGGGEGVGFAVPSQLVKRSIEQLRTTGEVKYGYLGVSSQTLYPQLASHLGLKVDRGALIATVQNGGPADKAGMQGGNKRITFEAERVVAGGDVVVAIGGQPVRNSNDLGNLIALKNPGQKVEIDVMRGGDKKTLTVTLGSRPSGRSG